MKSSYIVAALAVLAAGSAVAQSSVTVYGRLNVTAERQTYKNDSVYVLQNNASRLGFRGVEDLGGGLKASFTIEHRFNVDTGATTAGTFWSGESWVGLEGGFGKVRLGNMGATAAYYATADYISLHNHDTGTSADALYQYVGGGMQNTVAYTTPSFGGLTVEGQLGLSENAVTGRTYVLAANYDAGPLHIGAGYVKAAVGLPGNNVEPQQFGIRGLYELGDLTLGAYYIRDEDTWGANTKRDSARLSAAYAIGAGEIHGNIGWAGQIKNNGVPNDDATQFTFGYNHNLSKRTKVYAFYTLVKDDAGAYSPAITGDGATRKFSSLAVGVRHNF